MDFEKRLEKAIERGRRVGEVRSKAKNEEALNEEQLKRLHSQHRLELSEYIERSLGSLPHHFPGFQLESVVSDRGWGAAVVRDDVGLADRSRRNLFSRLELVVRPYSTSHVLELTARGTIRNKEVYNRTHYQLLGEVDFETFTGLIDLWVLEYAELYATGM